MRAMMQSAKHYPDPLRSSGSLFADPTVLDGSVRRTLVARPQQETSSTLTDVNESWHIGGTERRAWYVRNLMIILRRSLPRDTFRGLISVPPM